MMTMNKKRLVVAALAGVIAWSALCYALPPYQGLWAGWLFGLIALGILIGLLWRFSTADGENIVTRGARPLAGWQYLIVNLLWTGVATGVAYYEHQMPAPFFVAVHLCLLAWLVWKLLAMGAGAEKIASVRNSTREHTQEWHSFVLRIEQLKDTGDNKASKDLQRLFEAIRYAAPMEYEELHSLTQEIASLIEELETRLSGQNGQDISVLIDKAIHLVNKRNALSKSIKNMKENIG